MIRLSPIRSVAAALALGVLAGCAQAPFDESAPWRPTQAGEGRSFAGTFTRQAPAMGFEAFERERPVTAEDVEMPRVGGENPWATPPRDVVVTLCFGRLLDDRDEVERAAMEMCPAGTERLEELGGDVFWNRCPLIQPRRVAYQCVASADSPD